MSTCAAHLRISWALLSVAALASACGDTDTLPRQPNERPVAALEVPAVVSVDTQVLFDASESSDTDGAIVEYRYSPGDSDEILVAAEAVIPYTYAEPGTYTVTLTVIDDRGGKDSLAVPIVVEADGIAR